LRRLWSESVTLRVDIAAKPAVDAAALAVDHVVASGRTVYGVNTGFGLLARTRIDDARLAELQRALVLSHSAGTGTLLDEAVVRLVVALKAASLARGHSGVRWSVIEALVALVNAGVVPCIPAQGSVGASGDLAPLSHLALVLVGEGLAEVGGEVVDGAEALRRAGVEPLRLQAKEGLALNNGTQVMAGIGALALAGAERAVETAEVAGAMSLEALRGTPDAFHPAIMRARPHAGQAASAGRLRALLAESEIRESHRDRKDDPRVQDAYSLRCMPQVHGAARAAFAYARQVLEVEANSATDNPLIFPDEGEGGLVVSGGNFHGQPVAQVLDVLALALADLASISERRIERLVNPDLSGDLPPFLTDDPGVSSGFMIAQVTAAALVNECKTLAMPASVDSIPTGAGKEDHVSMGMTSAVKLRRVLRNVETVLGLELMIAAQGLEYRRPLRPGRGVERAYAIVRERIPPLTADRVIAPDIESAATLVRDGVFAEIWKE